ncbi:MAG: flagellar export protein FliJ [Proteobacteria bacterium]|jgi:flagellar FliJ protein|nr:flagellar export protein FliJ [Pseudomonadota bacterium]
MKKFKFPLEKVMQHRKIIENLAQAEFQEAQSRLTLLQEELAQMRSQVTHAHQHAFKTAISGAPDLSAGLTQVNEYLRGQDIRIENQLNKIKEQETVVENLREILRKAAVDHKIVESLKEKEKQGFKEEYKKYSQKNADELTLMRRSRKAEGE